LGHNKNETPPMYAYYTKATTKPVLTSLFRSIYNQLKIKRIKNKIDANEFILRYLY